jgi:hypothetical protein
MTARLIACLERKYDIKVRIDTAAVHDPEVDHQPLTQ